MGDLNKKLADAEKKMEQAQEEAKRSATEMERLLQLVQMSQEEQNAKEKQISDLQQWVFFEKSLTYITTNVIYLEDRLGSKYLRKIDFINFTLEIKYNELF